MKFRVSAPALLIVTAFCVVAATTAIGNLLSSQLVESAKAGRYRLMRDVLASLLASTEDRAVNRAELIASMPSVRTAFAHRDRPKLLADTERMFKIQSEKYGLDQAQFHVPPGVSFLRLHEPAKFGDDQTSYRPMLADAIHTKTLHKGLALTRAGPAIIGMAPMFDDAGNHTGSFEMGLAFEPMLDKMKQAYGLEAAAYFDEKMFREISTNVEPDVLNPQNRTGRFMRYHATHSDLMRALVTERDIEVSEPHNYERVVAGKPWGVQLVPMYNFAHKQIGVFALSSDLGEAKTASGRALVWQLLAALFGIVAMAGAILVVIRGTLIAPLASLNERMAALVSGDTSKAADPLESYCDELRTLASNYEQLRKRAGDES